MGAAVGAKFGSQNKGYEIYGFETENIDCIFIVNTEAVTPGATSFTIRTTGTCTYVVDWGDDSSETVTATTATHNYSTAGTYNVGIDVISGTFRPYYNNNSDGDIITKFRGKSGYGFTGSLDSAFYGCGNLDEITADFSQVTSIANAFRDTPLVDFQNTGVGVTVLNQNLFNFNDLTGITGFNNSFYNCPSLKTLAGLDFSSTTSFSSVFGGTTNLVKFGTEDLPIILGTTAGDLSLASLFYNGSGLTDFHVDTAQRVTNFSQTFYGSGSGLVNFGSEKNPIGIGSTADNSTLVTFSQAFYQSSAIKEFHVDYGDRISSLNSAFYASGITTFRIGDNKLTNVTNMAVPFYNSGLLSFGTEANPITFGSTGTDLSLSQTFQNTSSFTDFFITDSNRITNFNSTFYSSGIVNFGSSTTPIGIGSTADNSTLVPFSQTFYQDSSFKEFHLDYGERISSLNSTFYASGITTFRIGDNDLSNCTNMASAFYNSSIQEFGTEENPITFGSTGTDLSLSETFRNTSSLTNFFVTDSNRISNFNSTFYGSGIVNFGSETTPVGIGSTADNSTLVTFSSTFYQDSSFKEFHLDYGERISSLSQTFYNSGITTFRIGDNDLSNCTSIGNAFYNCSSISEFGTEANPITFGSTGTDLSLSETFRNTSSFTDFFVTDSNRISSFSNTFYGSGIVNFGSETTPVGIGSTADNSTLVTFSQSFQSVSAFKEFHLDYGERISSLYQTFYQSGITTFRIGDNDLTNVTSMSNAFRNTGLLSFGTEANPISFGSTGTDLSLANSFRDTSSLTDFFITDSARITSFQDTFNGSGIVNFGSSTTPVGIGSTADNSTLVTFSQSFQNVSAIREVHLASGERINNLTNAFYNSGITTFRIADNKLTNVTNMTNAFRGSGLRSFGSEANPIGIGSTADNATLFTFSQSFQSVSALREVHLDSGERINSLYQTFYNSGITTFRIVDGKLNNVTSMSNAFRNTGLLSFGTEANPISFGSTGTDLSLTNSFEDTSSLTDFFITDSNRISSFSETFNGSGIVNFGTETTPIGIGSTADNATLCTFNQSFQNVSAIREVHLASGERINSLSNTFYNSGITTFRIVDNKLTNVTNMTNAFRNSGLLSFGTEANPISFGSTADNATTFTMYQAFYQTNSLKEVHLDSGERINSLNNAFYQNSGITTFKIGDGKLTNVTNMANAFRQCGLLSFGTEANPISFGSTGTDLSLANSFQDSSSLTDFFITDSARITSLSQAIRGSGVVNFGTETTPIGIGSTADNSTLCTFQNISYQSSALREVHLASGERISSLNGAYQQNAGITTFRIADNKLTNVTDMTNAFNQCTTIKNFGTEANPIEFPTSGSTFSLSGAFSQAYAFKEFHITSGAMINSLSSTFNEATGITTFKIGDGKLTNVTNMGGAFRRSYALLSFGSEANPISFGSTGTNVSLYESFHEATALTDFFVVDSARISSLNNSVRSTRIVNFGTETTPIGIGSTADNSTLVDCGNMFNQSSYIREFNMDYGERISSLSNTFYSSGITTFRIGDNKLTNCTNMSGAFRQCNIISFGSEANPISFGNTGTNVSLYESFRDDSSLTDFFITDSARITSFNSTFVSTGLVNFGSSTTPVGIGSIADNSTLCDFSSACSGVSALREVHIDSGERISNMTSAFYQSGITTFRVNDTNMNNITNGTNTFLSCALDTASIENILVSCDNGGKSSITLTLSGGTNAAKSTWTSTANTAYTNLIGKSWTITYNS